MEKTIKKYSIVCLSCLGEGVIKSNGTTSSATGICPACNGTKVIVCVEEKVGRGSQRRVLSKGEKYD